MNTKKIGKVMRMLRNNKKWSLEYEASLLNIHRNTLSIYEEDAENMSMDIFEKFLEIHDITVTIFFTSLYDNSLIKGGE